MALGRLSRSSSTAPSTARSASRLWGGILVVSRSLIVANGLLARDGDLKLSGDLGVQTHRHGELAERLDGLVEPDAPALDLDPVLTEEGRDVGAPDGPEQPRLVRGLARLGEVQRLDGLGLSQGVGLELVRPALLPGLDAFEVLQVRGGRVERELLRQEV